MKYVERFFEEKLNKKLEGVLNKKYPKYKFKFKRTKTGGDLIITHQQGILAAIYTLNDFDITLNENLIKDCGNWYLDFAQDIPENVLKKIYVQTLKRHLKLDYYDSYIESLSAKNAQDGEIEEQTEQF